VPGRAWRLRLEYLRWGNDEMESRHGFRLPVEPVVGCDLAGIAKFEPPDGRLLLAFEGDVAFGIAFPDAYKPHWVFMERGLRPETSA